MFLSNQLFYLAMVDDWLLEHLAKVTSVSCVVIVLYFLLYSIWRISQMPNNPWNWNDWQWPLGGRHAVEIYRKPTEMPFTFSLDEGCKQEVNKITFTVNYLKEKGPPVITILWGPSVSHLMRIINSTWNVLNEALLIRELQPGQWEKDPSFGETPESACGNLAQYFILQRLEVPTKCINLEDSQDSDSINETSDELLESYQSTKFSVEPPIKFDWNLLKNQYRYPAAIFVTNHDENLPEIHSINGIIQIVHVKNEVFPNASGTLAEYIKMNNGQCHILQSLFVMDDHRVDDEDNNENEMANDEFDVQQSQPFKDILCSVCQANPVTRVIIPCRHVCLCNLCFERMESCPICRGSIMYYFKTRPESRSSVPNGRVPPNESEQTTLRQRVERWNERFNSAIGLTQN